MSQIAQMKTKQTYLRHLRHLRLINQFSFFKPLRNCKSQLIDPEHPCST